MKLSEVIKQLVEELAEEGDRELSPDFIMREDNGSVDILD